MKKYLFGMLAIALAVGFSAFTTPKKTITVRFEFVGDVTEPSALDVDAIDNVNSTSVTSPYYRTWERTTNTLTCPTTQNELACSIEVDANYTHTETGTGLIKLNATDPDGAGSKIAFPMGKTVGYTDAGTDFYKVTTSDQLNQIDVINRVHF